MRKNLMLALLAVILIIFNYNVYTYEQIKVNGDTVLLELAPVDPRSLMQGDYMRLRYSIESNLQNHLKEVEKGQIVIQVGIDNVAQFARLYQGEALAADEKLIKFSGSGASRTGIIKPNSFFFQEGHAKYYEQAKYGVFKVINSGKLLLVGLADNNKNLIIPTKEQSLERN